MIIYDFRKYQRYRRGLSPKLFTTLPLPLPLFASPLKLTSGARSLRQFVKNALLPLQRRIHRFEAFGTTGAEHRSAHAVDLVASLLPMLDAAVTVLAFVQTEDLVLALENIGNVQVTIRNKTLGLINLIEKIHFRFETGKKHRSQRRSSGHHMIGMDINRPMCKNRPRF